MNVEIRFNSHLGSWQVVTRNLVRANLLYRALWGLKQLQELLPESQ